MKPKKKIEKTGWIEEQYSVGKDYIEKIDYGGGFDIFLSKKNVLIFFKRRDELVKLRDMLDTFLRAVKK